MESRMDSADQAQSLRTEFKQLKRKAKDDKQRLENLGQQIAQLKPEFSKLEKKTLPRIQNKMGRLLGPIQLLESEKKHAKKGKLEQQYGELQKQEETLLAQCESLRQQLEAANTNRNDLLKEMYEDRNRAGEIFAAIKEESDAEFQQARSEFRQALERMPANASVQVADFYNAGRQLLLEVDKEYQAAARTSLTSFNLSAHAGLLKDAKNLLLQPHNQISHDRVHQIADKYIKGKFSIGRAVLGATLAFLGVAAIVAGFVFSAPTGGMSLFGIGAGYLMFSGGMHLMESSTPTKANAAAHRFAFAGALAPADAGRIQKDEQEAVNSITLKA